MFDFDNELIQLAASFLVYLVLMILFGIASMYINSIGVFWYTYIFIFAVGSLSFLIVTQLNS